MKAADIRKAFLGFFADRQHHILPSASLLPAQDPTLLFTNAGMVPFKQYFLGQTKSPYQNVASVQCCMRAGGKHNDLDNVGYTKRHHTFFEMLGNFSFGGYFKEKAIVLAWQFITEILKIDANRLSVTVYQDDQESADLWRNVIGLSADRIRYGAAVDNFWSMGDTGPCGPCTEIFYNHQGPSSAPAGLIDEDQVVEIWNLVFMEFNKTSSGTLEALPLPAVDTGMGLERVAAVMQGVSDNYQTDLFQPLIDFCIDCYNLKAVLSPSLKVLVDHIRATGFLMAEGVYPGNEGAGYVLRRIIRRALRHGHQLGIPLPFFHRMIEPLVMVMGGTYPHLAAQKEAIQQGIAYEEASFARTLDKGLQVFEQALQTLDSTLIPGDVAFKLYDTYGFPVDLVADLAKEKGLQLDTQQFAALMKQQKERARKARHVSLSFDAKASVQECSTFVGYTSDSYTASIVHILQDESTDSNQLIGIVLDHTPFYAESGGQVGDSGWLEGSEFVFEVQDTQRLNQAIVHYGHVRQGQAAVGMVVQAKIDKARREAIMRNHTATHLLHAALRQILGPQVLQRGSLVEASRLRFDFSYAEPLTMEQLHPVERLVNEKIDSNMVCLAHYTTQEEAKAQGALALFQDKYEQEVRVLHIDDFSVELCGGTHVPMTGAIGYFKITVLSTIAKGIKRIEAVTSAAAVAYVQTMQTELAQACAILHTGSDKLYLRIEELLAVNKQFEKKIAELENQLARLQVGALAEQIEMVDGVAVWVHQWTDKDVNYLRQLADGFKQQYSAYVLLLVSTYQDRLLAIASVAPSCVNRVPDPKQLIELLGGSGGGRKHFAQGGGAIPPDLAQKIRKAQQVIVASLTDVKRASL